MNQDTTHPVTIRIPGNRTLTITRPDASHGFLTLPPRHAHASPLTYPLRHCLDALAALSRGKALPDHCKAW